MTGLSADALAELDRLLAAEGLDTSTDQHIPRRDLSVPTPASFAQELLWMLDRATPGLTAYNLQTARRLRGPLNVPALVTALSRIVARHEALRTRFADGERHPIQVVLDPAPVPIDQVDLRTVSPDLREAEAQRLVTERARTPFDLAAAPPFRVMLIALADDDHVLLIETHHILVDGWSMGLLLREVATAYADALAGRESAFPPLPVQLGDVAAWERSRLAGPRLNELLDFWRRHLGNAASEPLGLPADFARGGTLSFEGAVESVVLPAAAVDSIRQLAQRESATLYMVLLAGFSSVLHRYTGRTNVLVGSGSAGRAQPETQAVVGYLNNTVVQRADFTGDPTFRELLGRVRSSVVDAFDHQDIPLEKLVLELREGQDRLLDAPLFEVVLTMQDTIGGSLTLEGLAVDRFGLSLGGTKFDFLLAVTERGEEVLLLLQYRRALFQPKTARRLLGHLVTLLRSAVENVDQPVSRMPMFTAEEQQDATSWNDTSVEEGPAATFVELFEAQAARVPTREAVRSGAGSGPTYEQLNARANQLAHQLRHLGVTRGAAVALLIDRSDAAVFGLLGILKSGGAYVPLSTDAPPARLAQQLAECGATIVVTTTAAVDLVPSSLVTVVLDSESDGAMLAARPTTNPAAVVSPDNLAYVLFTSGSTGVPKGVAITHANAVHYTRAVSRVLSDVPRTRTGDGLVALDGLQFGMVSTFAADLGNTTLFTSLLSGGTLHLLSKDVTTDPARFAEYLQAQPLDLLKLTPGHLAALVAGRTGAELGAVLPSRWIVLGGEALRIDFASRLLAAHRCRVLNHYGPTETTVGVCTFEATEASLEKAVALGARTVPIGRPLANSRATILDGNGEQVPIGIPGELVLGGDGVAQGYLQRPDLTAERFVEWRGDRVYRTGDRARRLDDGTIEFLGRTDAQVKVRGFRVELGEIELVLRKHSAVAEGVVVLRHETADDPELIAYVVPKRSGYEVAHGARLSGDALQAWLGSQLPEYMVPAGVVLLNAMPLTANGKVDFAALPEPGAVGGAATITAPRSDAERALHQIWADALKRDPASFGVTDDFLALGGHSLVAIRILGKISRTFGLRLPLRVLFDAPQIEQLAEVIELEQKLAALEGLAGHDSSPTPGPA